MLGKLGCPEKFIGLIRSLHDDMKAWVSFGGSLSDPIAVVNGVKQGDILAPNLFAIFFAAVLLTALRDNNTGIYIRYRTTGRLFNIRRLLAGTKVMTSLIIDLIYADDCDIVTHNEEDMQILMDCINAACTACGLEISLKKTVVMYTPAPGKAYEEPNIFVNGKRLDVVENFPYLGSMLSQLGSLDTEINTRIRKASDAFGKLEKRVWSQHSIQLKTKLSIYEACVLTALLYSSETWTTYRCHLKILESFHQRCLRRILNVKWTSFTSDVEILQRACISSIESKIYRNRLRWCGHVIRLEDNRIPKQLLYGELREGKRKPSKPKKRYKDGVRECLKAVDIDESDWETNATDRPLWRKMIYDYTTSFEQKRIAHSIKKRDARKMKDIDMPICLKSELTCTICGRICLSKAGLKSHSKSHQPKSHFQYKINDPKKCAVCSKVCKTEGGLKRHMKVHDDQQRHGNQQQRTSDALTCVFCNMVCKSLAGLKSHQRTKHRGTMDNGIT